MGVNNKNECYLGARNGHATRKERVRKIDTDIENSPLNIFWQNSIWRKLPKKKNTE